MSKQTKKAPQKQESSNLPRNILVVVILVIAGYLIYEYAIKKEEIVVPPTIQKEVDKVQEPQFKKEGELTFTKDGKEVKKIDIEIADNGPERQQGLMYRKTMDEARGMLFVFPTEDQQAFWMKNTILPLDIMFIGKDKKIVKIHKNTTPFSEKDLPSEKPAMYVVETVAGFADKYGLKEGDSIEFTYQ
ncbi:MAG: DUF192 domain-containing protein [Ignavibacteriae bacterium]|nr:DUF192 domain-containing protein [Ignavibacteriota bacterium]